MVQAVVPSVVVIDAAAAKRWQRALERAIAEALDVLIEPVSGEAFVESSSRPGTLYAVTATSCTCPAGQAGMPCKHRACYLAQMGEQPEPEPPAPAKCPCCRGGYVERWLGHDIVGDTPCDVCGGSGIRPVTIPSVAAAA